MSNRQRIIERIRKCLALSKSSNSHEAANALRMANALMEKHSIELCEAQGPELKIVDTSQGKRSIAKYTQPEIGLITMVGDFFGCTVYLNGRWPVIVGESPRPMIAQYAIDTLMRQLRRERTARVAEIEEELGGRLTTKAKRAANRSYSWAWVYAVSEKAEAFAKDVTAEERQQHQEKIFSYWDLTKIAERKVTGNIIDENDPFEMEMGRRGVLDGREANLNHGVGAEERQRAIGVSS